MSTRFQISPVTSAHQITQAAKLAHQIWTAYYTPILPAGQVPYMLEKFQSAGEINKQIQNGHQYFLIHAENSKTPVGYFDFYPKNDALFISKIYVAQSARGTGAGSAAFRFIKKQAVQGGYKKLELTVNKGNKIALAAYKKWGFKKEKAIVMDIGNGFVMDDFVMTKSVKWKKPSN